jgi:hypothetical protein
MTNIGLKDPHMRRWMSREHFCFHKREIGLGLEKLIREAIGQYILLMVTQEVDDKKNLFV